MLSPLLWLRRSRLAGEAASGQAGQAGQARQDVRSRTLARQRAAACGSEALLLKQVAPQYLQYSLAAGPAGTAAPLAALPTPAAGAFPSAAVSRGAAAAAAAACAQAFLSPGAGCRQLS